MKKSSKLQRLWQAIRMLIVQLFAHLMNLLELVADALEEAAAAMKEKEHGFNAKFDPPHKVATHSGKSFSISGDRFLSFNRARMNTLVVAPSGSGKTQVCVAPSIFHLAKKGNSMVLNDNSGEVSRFVPYLLSKGYRVSVLDFTFSDSPENCYFNPMSRIRSKTDAAKCAGVLVRSTLGDKGNDSKGSFFSAKSEELLTVLIYFLVCCCDPIYHNLANLLMLLEELQANPKKVEGLLSRAPQDLWRTYMSLLGTSENTRSSIVATAQASVGWIGNDPQLQQLTHKDTLGFDSLRKGKVAYIVRLPINDAKYYSVVAGLFYNQLFSHFFQKLPSPNDQDIHLILEEFSTFAPALPDFSNQLANSRKYRLPIMAVIQSNQQLIQAYGQYDAKTLETNFNTKVYFPGLTEEAEKLERILGKYSYKSDSEDKHLTHRPLMSAEEIRNMSSGTILVLSSGLNPIKIKTKPAFKQPMIMRAWNMPVASKCPDETETPRSIEIPLLDLSGKDIRKPIQTIH